jgi:Stigma-specific protein, Stig1
MRSPWWRLWAVFSLLMPLGGCSDPDVTFPPTQVGDASSDAAGDVSTPLPDADAGRGDAPPDVSSDPTVDPALDVFDRPETTDAVLADTAPPDDVTVDVPSDEESDVVDEPAEDGSHDAISEEGGTCASRCASGVCDTNGDCQPCVKDDECTGGRVCNAGTCGPRCGDGGVACAGNLVCCTEHCVDTTRDPRHCGACGATCTATQFCGNATTPVCREAVLRNLCDAKKATFLLNGLAEDDTSSGILRSAIASLCVPVPALTSVDQTMSVAINTTTGQPLAGGGELLVAAGGDSTQRLVRWLETSGTSTVYNETDGSTILDFKRRGGAADGGDTLIHRVTLATVTAGHDFFLAEVVKDPISGTFSLVVYGIDYPGTRAGAFYFANAILPNIVGADVTTFTQAWYIYEWTSVNTDAGPSMADTFTQLAAGL